MKIMKKIYSKPEAVVVNVAAGSMMQTSIGMNGSTSVQLSKRLDFLPEEEFEDEEW